MHPFHILGVFGGSLFSAMKKSSFHVPLLALLVLIISTVGAYNSLKLP